MNSSRKARYFLAIASIALVVFFVTALAAAGNNKPSQPAQHSGGGAQRPAPQTHGAPGGANRGPAGGQMNRPGGGTQGNTRPGGGQMNRPGGGTQGNNRPGGNQPGGGQMNRPGGGTQGNNRPGGQNQMNRPGGGTQGNNRPGGTQGNNRPGGTQGNNRPGGTQGNNRPGGAQGNNRPGGGNQNANRGNAGGHAPKGAQTHTTSKGNTVQTRANGSVRSVSGHGVTVSRGLNGQRRVVSSHNGRTTVAYGRHGGYTQRAYYRSGGREYVQRTYFYGGHSYAYAYRSYYWGGYPYYGFAPAFYWGPAYYGWVYNPWPAPVYYGWGWAGAPWFGFYGAYWAPYPVYPSAAFWLTDFYLSAALQAAYAAQTDAAAAGGDNGNLVPPQFGDESSDVIASLATSDPLVAANLSSIYGSNAYLLNTGAPAGNAPALTKEIKDAIAEEIKGQVAAEKTAAGNKGGGNDNGPPAAVDPNIRYFVVANDEDLTTVDGTECTLTGADVVYRSSDQPDNDHMVNAVVKASRKGECAVGATVAISVDDLQDMYNNMRQSMSKGMKEMADNSGKNGLPKAPDTSTTSGEVPAPTPDSNVQADLNQAQQSADQAEADAKQPN